MEMMDLVWFVAIAAVLVAMMVFSANDNARTVAAHKAALRRRFERDPDVSFEVQNTGEDRRLVHAYFRRNVSMKSGHAMAEIKLHRLSPKVWVAG